MTKSEGGLDKIIPKKHLGESGSSLWTSFGSVWEQCWGSIGTVLSSSGTSFGTSFGAVFGAVSEQFWEQFWNSFGAVLGPVSGPASEQYLEQFRGAVS